MTDQFVTVGGNHADLTVHAATGVIVKRRNHCDCTDCGGRGYDDIARFDPVVFARWNWPGGRYDILECGYWTQDGGYQEDWTVLTVEERGEMEFEDWVPMKLLPPPAGQPEGQMATPSTPQ